MCLLGPLLAENPPVKGIYKAYTKGYTAPINCRFAIHVLVHFISDLSQHFIYYASFSFTIINATPSNRIEEAQIVLTPNKFDRTPPMPAPIAKINMMPKKSSAFASDSLSQFLR